MHASVECSYSPHFEPHLLIVISCTAIDAVAGENSKSQRFRPYSPFLRDMVISQLDAVWLPEHLMWVAKLLSLVRQKGPSFRPGIAHLPLPLKEE